MTTEELDKRLDDTLKKEVGIMTGGYIIKDSSAMRAAIIAAVKPVISDCIDAVAPPRPGDLVATRFEVINHLSDGAGREMVVWKTVPFKVLVDVQDKGNIVKVFLSDVPANKRNLLGEK